MKNLKRVLALLLVISIVFAFAACAKAQIIGKWKLVDDDLIMNFKKDGTVVLGESGSSYTIEGTYKVKGNKLTMTVYGSTETMKIKSINGSRMVLVDEDGESVKLKKVK